MRRRVSLIVVVVIALAALSLFVTLLQRQRTTRDYVYTVNNLRELGQFVELNPSIPPVARGDAPGKTRFAPVPVETLRELGVPPEIPAGTRGKPTLSPDQRLSWISTLLPSFNQQRQPTADLERMLDPSQPWDAPPNAEVAATPLAVLQVYANPITVSAGEPVPTPFVGLGGIGASAPAGPRTPASGAFRYDETTPFALITDGLSETGLFADVSSDLGPWLRGGPATVRTFDPSRPAIGSGAQFGGNLHAGALFGYADHSVRLLSTRTDPAIVANLVTVAGAGKIDPIPGE